MSISLGRFKAAVRIKEDIAALEAQLHKLPGGSGSEAVKKNIKSKIKDLKPVTKVKGGGFHSSKVTFEPSKDYSGVVMQQGRVQPDSDFNEPIRISPGSGRVVK